MAPFSATVYSQEYESAGHLYFTKVYRGSDPLPQIVTVTGARSGVEFTASARTTSGGEWLSVSPGPECCITPAPLTLSVKPDLDLAPGNYSGQVVLAGGANPQMIHVDLIVTPPQVPAFDRTPSQLSFSTEAGGEVLPQMIQIGAVGEGDLPWVVIRSAKFLTVSVESGMAPTRISVGIDRDSLPGRGRIAGVYTAQLQFVSAGSTTTIPVTVEVGDTELRWEHRLKAMKAAGTLISGPAANPPNLWPANTANCYCGHFDNEDTAFGINTLAPDGKNGAKQLLDANPGSGSVPHYFVIFQDLGTGSHTISFHLKKDNTDWAYITSKVNGTVGRVWFNLVTGAPGNNTIPSGWVVHPSVSLGGGWFRYAVTLNAGSGVNASTVSNGFGLAIADQQYAFAATGARVFEWGQQAEVGSAPTAYSANEAPCMTTNVVRGGSNVPAGSPISFTISAFNHATPDIATTLTAPLPAGTGVNWSINPAFGGPGTCAITGAVGSQTLGCNFGTLAAGAGASVRVLSNTTSSSCGVYTVSATATGGGGSFPSGDSITVTCASPALGITKTHSGSFTQGQTGATYSVVVSNSGAATTSAVTVTETVPTGLTLVSMAGTGWTCGGTTCTRSNSLAQGLSYPAITVTVNVAANAPSSVTNQVSASGGGSATANASDSTVITATVSSAVFLRTDATAQGTWKGVYGADGGQINGDTISLPSYAQVTSTGQNPFVWASSTADVRGLQKFATSDRIASGWYTSSNMSIDVNLTDGITHQVAVYCLDWDGGGARAERIDVLDAVSNAVLDTRTISAFQNGQYLVWNLRGHVKLKVTLTGGSNAVVSGVLFGPAGPAAAFVGTDTTTQGTWKGMYGAEGEAISGDTTSYPSYAQVSFSGQTSVIWTASTADVRALQKVVASDRIASAWYTFSNMTIDVNLTDGGTHQLALYCLDWDGGGARAERIDVLDAVSNAVLDTRTISAFQNGRYLVWNLTGHVKLKVTLTGGGNAVVSGLFFGAASAPAAAAFVATDTVTQGTWKGVYGALGEVINGDTVSLPSYAQVSFSGHTPFVWTASTADVRALQKVAASDRIASGWYTFSNMTIDVNLTDGAAHQVALYCLDWDGSGARAERIDVLDAISNTVLDTRTISGFQNGRYLVWNLIGHVKLKITVTGGANAVVSGLFFGGASAPAAAAFVRTDTTAQGTWKGTYGADGEAISGDTTSYPSYAQVSFSGHTPFVWTASTADVRALQKVATADRVASGWYTSSNMSIDVNLTDGGTHQVSLYCLDWDGGGTRTEQIDVLDAVSNAVLDTRTISAFQNGKYQVWNLTGHVKLRVTVTGGANAVVSGVFFR